MAVNRGKAAELLQDIIETLPRLDYFISCDFCRIRRVCERQRMISINETLLNREFPTLAWSEMEYWKPRDEANYVNKRLLRARITAVLAADCDLYSRDLDEVARCTEELCSGLELLEQEQKQAWVREKEEGKEAAEEKEEGKENVERGKN